MGQEDDKQGGAGEHAPGQGLPPKIWVPGLLVIVLLLLAVFGLG
jgi:hypothetical protein